MNCIFAQNDNKYGEQEYGWAWIRQQQVDYNIMSRQYLKQLKERAQRLLDESSEEELQEEEEINAYTATQGTRSAHRIVLDEVLPEEEPQEVSEFYEHETTDIELLKRCISLTNQNNNLKFLVEKLSLQVDTLKVDLRKSTESEAALRKKVQSKEASTEREEELLKFEQAMQLIEQEKRQLQQQRSQLKLKQEELKQAQASLKQQWQEVEQAQTQGQKDWNRQSKDKEIQVHNDYTIRTTKREDSDKLRLKCEELQRRVGWLEEGIREERSKASRLCKFINKEVPALNAIIVQLTAKLDAKFERQILARLDL